MENRRGPGDNSLCCSSRLQDDSETADVVCRGRIAALAHWTWPYTRRFYDGFDIQRIESSKESYRVWRPRKSIRQENKSGRFSPTERVSRFYANKRTGSGRPGPTDLLLFTVHFITIVKYRLFTYQ